MAETKTLACSKRGCKWTVDVEAKAPAANGTVIHPERAGDEHRVHLS